MIKGKCPKCKARYYGWALLNPRRQSCSKCGVGLEVWDENSHTIFEGYSPFTAEKYDINPPTNVPTSDEEHKDSHQQ